MAIHIKSKSEIEKMRKAGNLVARTHKLIEQQIKVGVSTFELDQIAESFIKENGATPSFKGYHGYPGSICASVNDEVVHGIPSKDILLKVGDIISIDIGAYLNGFHGDAARTHRVGAVSDGANKLIEVTKQSFYEGLKFVRAGNYLHEISAAIQTYVEANGFSVVRDLVGHGIGSEMHEEPHIPNYKPVGRGPRLQAGMVLAIEPMVNIGKYDVRVLKDDWTIVTLDGSLSAHYENTVLVTDDGYELLTICQ
jgi:methionyl aminopeptidase